MTSSPGIAGRAQREVHGLRCPDRDEDLVLGRVPDAVQLVQVVRERAPQLDRAEVARVVGAALAQALDARLDDLAGRVEVRLPHPEADDVVHRRDDVEEAADPGRRHGAHALAQGTLGERGAAGDVEVGHRLARVRGSGGRGDALGR